MKIAILLLVVGCCCSPSWGAAVGGEPEDETAQALALGEAIEQEKAALSERDEAMLEAIVDEAIRQEEILRNRRGSESDQEAKERFSGHGAVDEYGPPPLPTSYKDKSFSLWSFKKMVFNALLQAIKAITGGVLALKGQIVKVKGHLVAAKGKLLETKGDAITEFGKSLATKALLTPVHVSNYDHNTPELIGPEPYPAMPYALQSSAPPIRAMSQLAASPALVSQLDAFGQLQTWPLSSVQLQALTNLQYPSPWGVAAAPPAVYGPPVAAPYPAAVSHSSYGTVISQTSDYTGPPPSSYGAPPSSFGVPPSAHQYLPAQNSNFGLQQNYGAPPSSSYGAPPSGFSAPSGPSYPPNYGSEDGWNKRGIKKSGLPDNVHAGLILLKPIRSVEPQHSVYKQPQAFSKSGVGRVDVDSIKLEYTDNRDSRTQIRWWRSPSWSSAYQKLPDMSGVRGKVATLGLGPSVGVCECGAILRPLVEIPRADSGDRLC